MIDGAFTGERCSALGRLHDRRQEDRPTFRAAERALGASARGNLTIPVSHRHVTIQCFRNRKTLWCALDAAPVVKKTTDGETMLGPMEGR